MGRKGCGDVRDCMGGGAGSLEVWGSRKRVLGVLERGVVLGRREGEID